VEGLRIGEATPEIGSRRSKQLLFLVSLQAAFLAGTYAVGVWLTTEVSGATVTTPEVIAHGVTSSGFATLTGIVWFLAAVQKKRTIARANALLFIVTVIAGATGFSFLNDVTNVAGINMANVSMMVAVGIGMPVTGQAISALSGDIRGEEHGASSASPMAYLALGALSLTIIAGAFVPTATFYATAVAAHVGLAALTVSLVLGLLVLTILEGSATAGNRTRWVPQRAGYSLLSLAAVSLAAGDGVIGLTGGGLSYIVVMAEVAVFVYAFLLLAIAAPYHSSLHLGRLPGMLRRLNPRMRSRSVRSE
jgi:hypothetical protein